MPPCPVALYMLAHSWEFLHSAIVSTLFKCTGDDVILFYSQQEVRLQIRPTGRAGGTRTSPARMGYVHIHAVLSQIRATHWCFPYLWWNCLAKTQVRHLSDPSEVTLCALHVCFSVVFMFQAVKGLFWANGPYACCSFLSKLYTNLCMCFLRTCTVDKIMNFGCIVCCHIVLDVESTGISLHTVIDFHPLHNMGSL